MSPLPLTTNTGSETSWEQPEFDWQAYWLEDAHRQAIRLAEVYANDPAAIQADAGSFLALFVGSGDRTRVGTFLMAYDSASRALEIERRDREDALMHVAGGWWADHDRYSVGATSYGAPWSPKEAR